MEFIQLIDRAEVIFASVYTWPAADQRTGYRLSAAGES